MQGLRLWAMDALAFRLSPIDTATADDLRRSGGEIHVAEESPGYPCRQCLRDAAVGEELVLVSHDPFTTDSPYRSASPIFLHREPCGTPDDLDQIPPQLSGRQLSVRSFDRREMMIAAAVIDGRELASVIDELLDDDASARLHVHNASRGCWAVTVDRA